MKSLSAGFGICLALLLTGCSGDSPVTSVFKDLMPPTPKQAASDLFNPYDPDARRKALALIQASPFGGEEVYVRTYRTLVSDEDSTVRAAAIRALGLHGQVKDAELIVPKLDDKIDYVRWEAARALQKIHNPVAIAPLMKRMRLSVEEHADVRQACAYALGQYAEQRVFQALVGALTETDFGVINAARLSLVTLTGEDLGNDGGKWLAWSKERQDLFANQREYTWMPFDKPASFLDTVQFWKEKKVPQPQTPIGKDDEGKPSENKAGTAKSS